MKNLTTTLALGLALCACDDDGGRSTDGGPAQHGDAARNGDMGVATPDAAPADPDMAAAPPPSNVPESGRWAITITLVEFGGIPVTMELGITATAGDDGGGTLDEVTLHGADEDDISDAVATVTDVPVAADGSFTIDFGTFTLPGPYSPSGSDVELALVLDATRTEDGSFCGGVTGDVVTFETMVLMSTFGAGPAADGVAPGACPGGADEMLPRIEDCPTLEPPRVTGFVSGGVERNFELYVPADHADGEKLPLVFLHHGLAGEPDPWGNVQNVTDASGLPALVDTERFILVVPNSRGLAIEWTQNPTGDNEDLAFFDDAITCVDAQYGVDPERIYAMGLSAGAIYTTYLAMRRSEVLAAAAAMSPILTVPYTEPDTAIPYLVAWGGEDDEAFDQDFHTGALDLIETFSENGHPLVTCNHGEGHAWATGGSPWMLRFAFDHPRGIAPPPYAGGLPDAFPEYCTVPE